MKSILGLMMIWALVQSVWAAGGGPDSFGYRWLDGDEPGGPVYQWTEIREIGEHLVLGDDDSRVVLLPRPFRFYGAWKDSMYICSNGFLSFVNDNASAYPTSIPNSSPPNGLVAPLWNDLDPFHPWSGGVYYYYDSSFSRFLVEWDSLVHFGTRNYYSFQAVLDFSDNSLTFLYRAAHPGWQADVVISGIEDQAGERGLEIASNLLRDQYVVRFFCPPDSHDIQAARIKSPSWHIEPEEWITPSLVIRNAGLACESFPTVCFIYSGGASLYVDTVMVNELMPGDSTEVAFRPWLAGSAGLRYTIVMYSDHKNDQNHTNDTLRLEVVAFAFRNKIESRWRQGVVTIDGVISPEEWPESTRVDVSDILGRCGTVQPLGSTWLYAQNDSSYIYLALNAPGDAALEEGDIWTLHLDDDGDGAWAVGGNEGKYRLAYYSVETLEFTPLPGGLPGPAPGILRASSSSNGSLQREMAIPLGTAYAWQLARGPGEWCRLQISTEDGGTGTVLGWWPQDMEAEVEENPFYYGRIILAASPSGIAKDDIWQRGTKQLRLSQNKPNPFSQTTTINYQITRPGLVSLKIYNVVGQEVRTLVRGKMPAGEYYAVWDGRDTSGLRVAPGVYLIRIIYVGEETGRLQAIKRMLLVD